ncbi:MAG: hypothetical protein ACE5GF_01340 [Thermodesulfobacteriota bacterium]
MKSRLAVKDTFVLVFFLFFLHFVWNIASLFNPEDVERRLACDEYPAPLVYIIVMAVVISSIPSLLLDIAPKRPLGRPWRPLS